MKRFAIPFAAVAVSALAYSVAAEEILHEPVWSGVRAELVPAPGALVPGGEDDLPPALLERLPAEPEVSRSAGFVSSSVPQAPVRTVVPSSPEPGSANNGVSWVRDDGRTVPVPVAQPARTVEPAASAASATEPARADVSVKLVVTVNGEDHFVELPPASVAAVVLALSQAAAPAPASAVPAVASPVPTVPAVSRPDASGVATIFPSMPWANGDGVYRVQVGSFLGPALARDCFDRLAAAGLSPRFELFGDRYRVVIPGVTAAEVPAVARRLGDAGFHEAWIRRETE